MKNISKSQLILLLINTLTLSRIPLSLLVFYQILFLEISVTHLFFSLSLILFSDFLDGKLSRKYQVTTTFGAFSDVGCDFFFMFSSSLALSLKGLIPVWYLAVISFKFIEFLLTSKIFSAKNLTKHPFLFDWFGRLLASLYYLTPLLILFLHFILSPVIKTEITLLFFYSLLPLSLLSTVQRIFISLQSKKMIS